MNEIKTQVQNIKSKIEKSNNILLVTHQNPDSDALGSICAFSKYLDKIRKTHFLLAKDTPLPHFSFLANSERIKSNLDEIEPEELDLIIALDAGDLDHAGIKKIIRPKSNIINIDHHPTNTYFGEINLIVSQAVSTTEILYHFFRDIDQAISEEIATCLLAGIIGDTNNFTNHNTTPSSLKIAAQLLSAGAQLPFINASLFDKKTIPVLNLWGKILTRLAKNEKFNTVGTVVAKDDLARFKNHQKAIDGLTNFLNNLADVKVTLVLKETEDNKIKISLRSNDELIDLTKFVKIFNGGGHKKAAGFTINGRLVESENGWQII